MILLTVQNLDAVLAACEELNAPSEIFTVEGQVASDVADSSLVYGDMKAFQDSITFHQLKKKQ